MDNSDWRRIGDQLSDTVSRALSSREFREIQGTIQNTVHEIQTAFKNEFSGYAPQTPPAPPPAVPPRKTKTRTPGRTAGTLLLVFGAIGFGAAALTALISSVLALTSDRILPFMGLGIGVFLPLLAVFGGMMLGGGALRRRAQRYLRYREELGDSAFCPVGVLASAVGKRPRFVARDLRRMIGLGLFPGAPCRRRGHLPDAGRRDLPLLSRSPAKTGRGGRTKEENRARDDGALRRSPKRHCRGPASPRPDPGLQRRDPGGGDFQEPRPPWMRSPPPSSLMLRRTRRSCPRSGGFSTTICPPPSVCSRRTNPSVASRSRESIWTRPVPRSRARWTPWCRPFPTCWTA